MYTEQLLKYTNIAMELASLYGTYKWYEIFKKLALKKVLKAISPLVENEIKTFNQNPYNQLRQLLTEMLGYKNVTELYERYEIGEPYEEHTLQDILLAISNKTGKNYFTIDTNGRIANIDNIGVAHYDLTKNLTNQSDETLLALIEIVK